LAETLAVLSEVGQTYYLYDEISENPDLGSIMKGKGLFNEYSCDFVIGIGGGSPLDAAKAIALAAANDLQESELYDTSKFTQAYPIVAIPTTSGTGSEATQYSVLTDTSVRKKAGFGHDLAFPRLAILDPRYTLSLPKKVTLHTSLDALSHLLEGLYSKHRSPLVYPLIHKGIALIMKHLPIALTELDNLHAREELMRASLYGGMVIAQGSTTLQHSIGYPLTARYGTPHGLANAMVMEAIMNLYYPAVGGELEELFAALDCSRKEFYAWLQALPFMKKMPISDEFIKEAIPQIMTSRNMALNPLEVKERDIREILEKLGT
ncbi:MAG: iron-containing alcohol dehydrogenase, partial [Candidatus Cloacimonas sp.]|jgi:alcohol dehydrogenase|nr:iron-containing alcohol dehydrogenase [Candidatus Cloacimonas sp.]